MEDNLIRLKCSALKKPLWKTSGLILPDGSRGWIKKGLLAKSDFLNSMEETIGSSGDRRAQYKAWQDLLIVDWM